MKDWMDLAKESMKARNGDEAVRDLLYSNIKLVSGDKSADGRRCRLTFLNSAHRLVILEFGGNGLSIESFHTSDISWMEKTNSVGMINEFRMFDAHSPDDNDEVRRLFHDLWSRDVHTEGYDKDKWRRMTVILENAGYEV